MELLSGGAEGNVNTLLRALRYHIELDRVEAPSAAIEHARQLAQQGVPVNALVRSYGSGRAATDVASFARVAVLQRITATLFEYIGRIPQQVVAVYEEEHERWLDPEQYPRREGPRAVGREEDHRRRRGNHIDPLSAQVASPCSRHVVSRGASGGR